MVWPNTVAANKQKAETHTMKMNLLHLLIITKKSKNKAVDNSSRSTSI